jgi:hypothetical protein
MITNARAQLDLIATLHLEALFKMGHLDNAGEQTAIPRTTEQESLQLERRLAVIRSLAVRAQDLTVDDGGHKST